MKKQQKFYKKSKSVEVKEKATPVKKVKKSQETIVYSAPKVSTSLHRLIIPPAVLISVLFLMLTLYLSLQLMLKQIAIDKPIKTYTATPYPIVINPTDPIITAQTAIVLDETARTILYERNSQFRFSMASTTKIMTALIGLSQFNLSDELLVQRPHVEGTTAGFKFGDRVRFEDVLYGLLLPSGNDAAYIIADNYPGGVQAFVAAMNAKAAQLQLLNTHYGDPAGLNDDENFTIVKELANLASYAIQNPTIARIVSTKEKTITTRNGNVYQFSNLNRLLGTKGVTGVKTGTTEGAGEVLVTSKVENGRTFIIIVMKSQDRFSDTSKLLDFISQNVSYISPQFPFLPNL